MFTQYDWSSEWWISKWWLAKIGKTFLNIPSQPSDSPSFSLFRPSIVMKWIHQCNRDKWGNTEQTTIFLFLGGKLSHCPIISVTKMSRLHEHHFPFSHFKILMTQWFNLKSRFKKVLRKYFQGWRWKIKTNHMIWKIWIVEAS